MARKLPIPIEKEEFYKMLEYAKKEREHHRAKRSKKLRPRGLRLNEYIIAMCFGFGAGMRISEIVGLNNRIKSLTKDQIEENLIRVIGGKGGKDRIVPLPSKVFKTAGITRSELEKSLPLSTTRRSIQRYVQELGKKVLKKHITFHTLRHTFVTHALESGMPIHQVQMFAGHSRLDTTGIYLHVKPKEALDKYGEVF